MYILIQLTLIAKEIYHHLLCYGQLPLGTMHRFPNVNLGVYFPSYLKLNFKSSKLEFVTL